MLFVSNQIEVLISHLASKMYETKNPFLKRYIVTPGPILASFIQQQLSHEKSLGIFMGATLTSLEGLFTNILGQEKLLPSLDLLALDIENRLQKDYKEYIDPSKLNKSSYLRNLASSLSREFVRYCLYCKDETVFKSNVWQKGLFQELKRIHFPTTLEQNIKEIVSDSFEVHLFAIPFIPRYQQRALERLSDLVTTRYYYLSPSCEYWIGDLSPRAREKMVKKYKAQGIREEEIRDLKNYLKESHPLLASFGIHGKEIFKWYEEKMDMGQEDYREYSDNSLLERLQKDLLEARPFSLDSEEIILDDSIQLYASPSKFREIEVLLDFILETTARNVIQPTDIIIVVPSIEEYFPYIHLVFSKTDIPFDYEILDLPLVAQSPFLEVLFFFLSLHKREWNKEDILELFAFPSIQETLKYSETERQNLEEWIDKLPIFWGYHKEHRTSCFLEEGYNFEGENSGTWKQTWHNSLIHLVVPMKNMEASSYSQNSLDMGNLETIGQAMSFLEKTYVATCRLVSKKRTLDEWAGSLREFLIDIFGEEERFQEEDEGWIWWNTVLNRLHKSSKNIEGAWDFDSIFSFLEKGSKKLSKRYARGNRQKILFTLPNNGDMSVYKVVYWLGLQEGVFPRIRVESPLELFDGSQMETESQSYLEDRYFFLISLLASRQFLRLSYVDRDAKDGKRQNVSSLVSDLFAYLDLKFSLNGKTPSDVLIQHYEEDSVKTHETYLKQDIFLLTASRNGVKKPFFPNFYDTTTPLLLERVSSQETRYITFKQLKDLAKNPLKCFFENSLKISLRKDEEEQNDAEFCISGLTRYAFHERSMKIGYEKSLESFKEQGILPQGRFLRLAENILSEEHQHRLNFLQEMQIRQEELVTLRAEVGVTSPQKIDLKTWVVPPIKIELSNGQKCILHGTLQYGSSQGLCVYKSNFKEQTLLELWPEILLYLHLAPTVDLGFSYLCNFKDGERKDLSAISYQEALANFIEYYLQAELQPMPLFPEIVEKIINDDVDGLEKKIEIAFSIHAWGFKDAYQEWLIATQKAFSSETIYKLFSPMTKKVFTPWLSWVETQ